ncbi:MAG: hypothetical protein M1481_01940 [Candidatus Thermoplasmatota archaeon]|jgi:hypothetical protein|nr:hypothetical protein [Candidatus Thermoplasmatota archaeon]
MDKGVKGWDDLFSPLSNMILTTHSYIYFAIINNVNFIILSQSTFYGQYLLKNIFIHVEAVES